MAWMSRYAESDKVMFSRVSRDRPCVLVMFGSMHLIQTWCGRQLSAASPAEAAAIARTLNSLNILQAALCSAQALCWHAVSQ